MPTRLRMTLFGPPTVEVDGATYALPVERRSQLVALLAAQRGWMQRADVAAMLWPDAEARLAHANLRKTLFRLPSLPWAPPLEIREAALRLAIDTDVAEFEDALAEGRVADAVPLVRGPFLAGFDDERSDAWTRWLAFERERLRGAWRSAVLERLAADIASQEGVALSAQLIDDDALDEAAVVAHMTWLARDGQAPRAQRTFRDYAGRLRDELGLEPAAALKALAASLEVPGANLRPGSERAAARADDAFIGRSAELARLRALFARDDCRLVCIVGPGGAGKTSLARRAQRELDDAFADGSMFVPLEDARTVDEAVAAIALAAGAPIKGAGDALDHVIRRLAARRLLLVLDNVDPLADAPLFDRLLERLPVLAILATSRVRLASPRQWSLPLDGLPWPEPDDDDRAEAFDAVRLFVQTAHRFEPGLSAPAHAAAIATICRRVEGLPLALELAAAWTRVMSPEDIAIELAGGTSLLRAPAAHGPRQVGIDAVFERSWTLLTAVERTTLARLSVFRGGFSIASARAVAGASLPVLGSLVDNSLVRRDAQRMSLHPLVHEEAAARLEATDRDAVEHRHARYFLELLEQLNREVEDGASVALAAVEAEFENCRAAWRHAVAHGMQDVLLRALPTVVDFCDHRGRIQEGIDLVEAALRRDRSARNLAALAHLRYRVDRYVDAEADALEALALSRSTHDEVAALHALKVLGGTALRLGRHEEARRHFAQALRQPPARGNPRQAAAMLDNLALVEKALGHYEASLRMSTQSLAEHRQLGDVAGVALCLNNLGALLVDRGEYAAGRGHFDEGLALCKRFGLTSTRLLILANLSELAMKTGDAAAAEARAREALDIAEATGNAALKGWLGLQFARVALARRDFATARVELRSSIERAVGIGRPGLVFQGVLCFAEIVAAQGSPDAARRALELCPARPSLGMLERDAVAAQLETLGGPTGRPPPAVLYDELVERIVVETPMAFEPLIRALTASS